MDLADEDLDGVLQEQHPPGGACLVYGPCHVRAVLPHTREGVLELRAAGDRDQTSDALGREGAGELVALKLHHVLHVDVTDGFPVVVGDQVPGVTVVHDGALHVGTAWPRPGA